MKNICQKNHDWDRLNKRVIGELTEAFCDSCDYVDDRYTRLQQFDAKHSSNRASRYVDQQLRVR